MKEQILALREKGYTYNQIVEQLGCAKSTVSYHCGSGQKEKTRSRERDRRNLKIRYIQEYKQSRGCMDCGEKYPYWMLDLDHVFGEKISNVSDMRALFNLEQIQAEVAKCQVVCANCHRIRTWQRLLTTGNSITDLDDLY